MALPTQPPRPPLSNKRSEAAAPATDHHPLTRSASKERHPRPPLSSSTTRRSSPRGTTTASTCQSELPLLHTLELAAGAPAELRAGRTSSRPCVTQIGPASLPSTPRASPCLVPARPRHAPHHAPHHTAAPTATFAPTTIHDLAAVDAPAAAAQLRGRPPDPIAPPRQWDGREGERTPGRHLPRSAHGILRRPPQVAARLGGGQRDPAARWERSPLSP